MNWINKIVSGLSAHSVKANSIPEGLWVHCPSCSEILYRPDLEKNLHVCTKCNFHMRMGARERLLHFLDADATQEIAADIAPKDRLKFKDTKRYKDRLYEAQHKTKEKDALVVMQGKLSNIPVTAAAFVFDFMGGSMGSVVGERFFQGVQHSLMHRKPFICFTASGGARMQEALISLMQMAKTSAVLARLKMQSIPYIVILTDPTYGGVSASLAMLGDISIAEPGAMIGFAGPRVIAQTVRQKLPEGFQQSEFLLEHGMIDMIVHRRDLSATVSRILHLLWQPDAATPAKSYDTPQKQIAKKQQKSAASV